MHDVECVHEDLVSIAVQRDRLQTRQARLLVLAEELEVWRHFHCAHIYEYLERYCDLQPRTAREHIRVARALAALPLTRAKLDAEQVRDGPRADAHHDPRDRLCFSHADARSRRARNNVARRTARANAATEER